MVGLKQTAKFATDGEVAGRLGVLQLVGGCHERGGCLGNLGLCKVVFEHFGGSLGVVLAISVAVCGEGWQFKALRTVCLAQLGLVLSFACRQCLLRLRFGSLKFGTRTQG